MPTVEHKNILYIQPPLDQAIYILCMIIYVQIVQEAVNITRHNNNNIYSLDTIHHVNNNIKMEGQDISDMR